MITRGRGRVHNIEIQSLEDDVIDVVETKENRSVLSEHLPVEDTDAAGLELDDFMGIEDLKWTFERDSSSPLFDMGLTEFDLASIPDNDSGTEASAGASPERMPEDGKIRGRPNRSSKMATKNAIAARLNRLKKKEYVTSLEKKVGVLSKDNNVLKQENSQLNKRVEELEDETRYLRAVLANQSMLSQLLSRLSGVNGMKLSSSLFQEPNSNDHDYALPRKRVKVEEKETSGGVCLHVDKNHVSVEFCTKCAESASASFKM